VKRRNFRVSCFPR